MKKQRGGSLAFGIGFGFAFLILAGLVVAILYVTGVIAKRTSSASSSSGTPVGPSPNPNTGIEIKTTISDPQVEYAVGPGPNEQFAAGIQFNAVYDPSSYMGFPGTPTNPLPNWVLNENVTVIYSDGSENTTKMTSPGAFGITSIALQPLPYQIGFNRQPVRVEFDAYLTYQNEVGRTITGPVSNKLSVQIPPPK